MRVISLVAVLVLVCACTTTSQVKSLSAGVIGCQQEDITIADLSTNYMTGMSNWTALCKGQTFICSSSATGTDREKELEGAE